MSAEPFDFDAWSAGEEGTRVVEAMARADHERAREVAGRYVKPWPAWEALDPVEREAACDAARVMLRAALSLTTTETCKKCGGRGSVPGRMIDGCVTSWPPCPDCKGGTVPGEPLVFVREQLEQVTAHRIEGGMIRASETFYPGWQRDQAILGGDPTP